MNYDKALQTLISKHGIEVLKQNFLIRCYLSDYAYSSFTDSRLVSCFCWLNERVDLFSISQNGSLDDFRKAIMGSFKESPDAYSKLEISSSLNPLTEILYPQEYQTWSKKKKPVNKEGLKALVNKAINNAAKAKAVTQKKVTQTDYYEIVFGNCIANVYFANVNKISAYDVYDKPVDITKHIKSNKGKTTYMLQSLDHLYKLVLPQKGFCKQLTIKKTGYYSLSIKGRSKVDHINVIGNDNSLFINGTYKNVDIQDVDYLSACCDLNTFTASVNGRVYYYLNNNGNLNVNIVSNNGDIKGNIVSNYRVKASTLFNKVSNFQGSYIHNGYCYNYNLKAPYGKIKTT